MASGGQEEPFAELVVDLPALNRVVLPTKLQSSIQEVQTRAFCYWAWPLHWTWDIVQQLFLLGEHTKFKLKCKLGAQTWKLVGFSNNVKTSYVLMAFGPAQSTRS